MYALMRRIHGYSGLLLLLFMIMYFATGVLVTEQDRIDPAGPDLSSSTHALAADAPRDDGPALSVHLQRVHGIQGRRVPPHRGPDGEWVIRYYRPGENVTITVPAEGSSITLERERPSTAMRLIRLHRSHGYGGGFVFDVWALLYDVVSLATIGFALSGIYLWYRRTKDRRLGWSLLIVSWGFTIGTMVWLWTGG